MVLAGGGLIPDSAAQWLAAMAVLVSAVNIGGGFTITQVRKFWLARLQNPNPKTLKCEVAAARPRLPGPAQVVWIQGPGWTRAYAAGKGARSIPAGGSLAHAPVSCTPPSMASP